MSTSVDTNEQPEVHDGWLRVRLGADGHADFHHRWLRHNCPCDRHPTTGEHTLCSSEIPEGIRPREARVSGDELHLTWEPDGHRSVFALGWLRQHAYALNRRSSPPPSDLTAATVSAAGRPLDEVVTDVLERVERLGLAVVRGGGVARPEDETEALIDALAARSLRVIGTHFGRIEDLRTDNTTNQNTDQLGYTDATIELHTDQPFLESPPRYQLLQSVRLADEGGDNFFVDALAAFRYLGSLDAEAARLLREVPVRFHRKQKQFESIVDGPLVRDGDTFQIRFSYFTLAPHRLPFEQIEPYYRAHDRFARLVRDPANQYRTRLAPGDWVLYDNHRMLHARTGFRGPRWVRGVYFDR